MGDTDALSIQQRLGTSRVRNNRHEQLMQQIGRNLSKYLAEPSTQWHALPMRDLVYRTEFIQALTLLGRACRIASSAGAGFAPPILVGGAVVEFDTAGQFVSGDFDFVTASDESFIGGLQQAGFVRDERPGVLRRAGGWVHPELLIGVDMVSGSLFDGKTDRRRMRVLEFVDGEVLMPPTEDMIADRMGQWEASDRKDRVLLEQACAMFTIADQLDHDYLEQRIRDETAGISGVQVLLQHSKR